MSKLYVFGCSHSAKHGNNLTFNVIKNYYDFRNGNFPKTWSELLSEYLNYELLNFGEWGYDNYTIFSKFCKNLNNINKNDIVIIGWSELSRFRMFSEKKNTFISFNRGSRSDNQDCEFLTQSTIDEILVNRFNYMWVDEVYDWMSVIDSLSNKIDFKVIYWSFYGVFPKLYILDKLLDLGAETISEETKGLVTDKFHLGEKGHIIQYEYFKEKLKT